MGGAVSAEPLSWQGVQAIRDRLESALIANGYLTDIGQSVHLDTAASSKVDSPRLAVIADEFTPDSDTSNSRIRNTDIGVTVEVVMPADYRDAERVAHRALTDIRLCLKDTSDFLPTDARSLVPGGARIIRRPDGAAVIVAQMDFTLRITERSR